MNERINNSETHQSKAVFPCNGNDQNTMFGGTTLQWMDEVAYITATRFTRMRMVTVSVEKVKFILPIQVGTIIEIIGRIVKVGNVKVKVQVEVFREGMYSDNRLKAAEGLFTFAAIDENNMPVRITN